MYKRYRQVVIGLAVTFVLILGLAAQADAVYVDRDTNPIKMVLTSTGGISLEAVGQEKYIQTWDRASGKTERLPLADTNIQSFDVEGNNLPYTVYRGGDSAVYLYNLATRQQTAIDSSSAMKENIRIAGSNIVWTDFADGKPVVVLYNTATGKKQTIFAGLTEQEHIKPVISAKYVAWISYYNGMHTLYAYNIATGATEQIRNTVNAKLSLDIDNDKLVWAETLEAGDYTSYVGSSTRYYDWLWGAQTSQSVSNIWLYDLTKKTTTRLTDSASSQAQCTIVGNQVAWVDTNSGNPDLQVMDLATRKITTIAATDVFEVQPALGYGYIAWIDLKGNLGDLQVEKLAGGTAVVTPPPAATVRPISLVINGTSYTMSPAPYQKSNLTMVPMRRIFELLGVTVTWNDTEQSVTAVKGDRTVKLYIGKTAAAVNGRAVTLGVAPELVSSTTMIPVRFVTEALGGTVGWTEATRTVSIQQ